MCVHTRACVCVCVCEPSLLELSIPLALGWGTISNSRIANRKHKTIYKLLEIIREFSKKNIVSFL